MKRLIESVKVVSIKYDSQGWASFGAVPSETNLVIFEPMVWTMRQPLK